MITAANSRLALNSLQYTSNFPTLLPMCVCYADTSYLLIFLRRSPDPSSLPCRSPEAEMMEEEPMMKANQVVWKGFVNMSGLAKFATTAYPVSGPADNLHEVKGRQS